METESTKKQKVAILNYLQSGGELTGIEALEKFKTMKLASRISELIKEGNPIEKEWVETTNGKKVMKYSMKKAA